VEWLWRVLLLARVSHRAREFFLGAYFLSYISGFFSFHKGGNLDTCWDEGM